MGVREIRQQPCVMIKNGVIVFFYVDDIVFAYPWAKKAELGKLMDIVICFSSSSTESPS